MTIILLLLAPIIHDSLPNGFDYYLWPDHHLPMVEIRVTTDIGSIYDPEDLPGLANLTHLMLERGTEDYTYLELLNLIESMGARLSVNVGREQITVKARCLSKHLSSMLRIIGCLIRKPTFPEDEIERLKTEIIGRIRAENDDPFAIGINVFYDLIYEGHPLAHSPIGTEKSVMGIEREEVVTFYQDHYLPNISVIALCGDLEVEPVVEILKSTFGDWKRNQIKEIPSPPTLDSTRIRAVTRDLSQAYIFFGNTGMARNDSSYLAARLGNFVLGGSGLTSRLSNRIREEGGLAYIAFSRLRSGKVDHPFVALVQTKVDSAPSSVKMLIEEVDRIRREGIDSAEYERTQSYYSGHFPIAYDTYRERADLLVYIHRFRLGIDYLDRFPEMIGSISLKDVNEALSAVIDRNFGLVVVGPIDSTTLRSWLPDKPK